MTVPPARTPRDQDLRCAWAQNNPLLRQYHDAEWGRPERDGRALWEKLMLDGMQAGLSWLTILRKREALRRAFVGFTPQAVAALTQADVSRLLQDASIVRSRSKIEAVIGNARAYLHMQEGGENFAAFAWHAVGDHPVGGDGSGCAPRSPQADALARQLRARGFRFTGPTIVHAWLQATGLVVGHELTCPWHPARLSHRGDPGVPVGPSGQ